MLRGQESIASPLILTYQGGWSLDEQPELLAYRQDLNRLRETLAHELTHATELTVQREAERLARRLGLDRWLLPATHPQVAAGWTALPLGVGRLAPLARRLLQAARQQPLESDRLRFLEKFLEYAEARDQALRDPLGVLFRLFMEDLPYRGYLRGLEYLPWLLSVQWPVGRTMPELLEKLSSEERDIPALVSLASDLQRRLWQAVARTPASPAP